MFCERISNLRWAAETFDCSSETSRFIKRSSLAPCLVLTNENCTGMALDNLSKRIRSTCKRCFTLLLIVSCASITLAYTSVRCCTKKAAAAVGVFTRWKEIISSTLSSRSCPIPVMIGNGKLATFSASDKVSKPERSLVAPPPRMMTTQSQSSHSALMLSRAAITLCSTPSPCIVAGKRRVRNCKP